MKQITKIEAIEPSVREKLRVAAYARVSTSMDSQIISLEAQKNHYERLIKSRPDLEFVGLYYDEGISGTKMEKRDGLLSMLDDCEKGKIDYIVVKSISRFSRNTLDSVEMVRKLQRLGVYIYFEKENIDTGKMEGELLLSILSSLAESESRSISSNSVWSIHKRFSNGTYKIAYPPYGYKNENGKMIVIPEQGEIVKWIYAQVLSGISSYQIAKALNERDVLTKKNSKWSSQTVIGIIRNEKYTGDVILQKTYTDDMFNRHINRGEKNQYYIKDHHEALISREEYETANKIIDKNRAEKGIKENDPKYSVRYAFSGKIICGECGSTWKRKKLYGYFGYNCRLHLEDKNACSMKSIREDKVKAAFATMMNKLTFGSDKLLKVYHYNLEESERSEYLDDLKDLDDALEENVQKKKKLNVFYSKGFIDTVTFEHEKDRLKKEHEMISEEKNAIINLISGDDEKKKALKELISYTSKGDMISEYDEDLFIKFVDHIIVYSREEIGFAMKCGPVFRERID